MVILGGGFGGLAAANELRDRLPGRQLKITIIDKKDWFMVGFAKLWIITGARTFEDSAGSLRGLPARKGIDFVRDEIVSIDLQNRRVGTGSGAAVPYDFLVIAMGAALAPERIPGLADNGLNLYDHAQLTRMRDRLAGIRSGRIAIAITAMPYKCPPAPFEAALLVDSMLRSRGVRDSVRIDLYGPAPIALPAAGPGTSRQILDMVGSEGIAFHGSRKTASVRPGRLVFEDGTEAGFDLLLAVPPHVAPAVVYDSGLAKEPGFIPVDRDCQTPFAGVFAVGDVTTMQATATAATPKAGVFAEGEGATVARSIASQVLRGGRPPAELFDGRGGCFIESGRGTASVIDVDMFPESGPPTARLTEPTPGNLARKVDFERERLQRWL